MWLFPASCHFSISCTRRPILFNVSVFWIISLSHSFSITALFIYLSVAPSFLPYHPLQSFIFLPLSFERNKSTWVGTIRNIYKNFGMCWKVLWAFSYFYTFVPIFIKLSGRLSHSILQQRNSKWREWAMSFARRKTLPCRSGLTAVQTSTGPPLYSEPASRCETNSF
jgi:hypothetical protein